MRARRLRVRARLQWSQLRHRRAGSKARDAAQAQSGGGRSTARDATRERCVPIRRRFVNPDVRCVGWRHTETHQQLGRPSQGRVESAQVDPWESLALVYRSFRGDAAACSCTPGTSSGLRSPQGPPQIVYVSKHTARQGYDLVPRHISHLPLGCEPGASLVLDVARPSDSACTNIWWNATQH